MGDRGTKVIAANAPAVGADAAISSVPEDYQGACAVVEASSGIRVIAVLPNKAEAFSVARYAITPDGGYGSVYVDASNEAVTHSSFEEWAFGVFTLGMC